MEIITDVEKELDIVINESEPLRDGVLKVHLNDIFGNNETKTIPISEIPISENITDKIKEKTSSEPEQEKSQKEIFAEVKAMAYGFNFVMVTGSALVAKMFSKEIDSKNISASETELQRLAKVAQPVYEKYMTGTSPETLLLISILGIYGFKIAGEFMNCSDLAKKTSKEVSKVTLKNKEADDESSEHSGDKRYFQTGNKKGTLKPSHS